MRGSTRVIMGRRQDECKGNLVTIERAGYEEEEGGCRALAK